MAPPCASLFLPSLKCYAHRGAHLFWRTFDRHPCFNIISIPVRCEHIVGTSLAQCPRFWMHMIFHILELLRKCKISWLTWINLNEDFPRLWVVFVIWLSAGNLRCSRPPNRSHSPCLSLKSLSASVPNYWCDEAGVNVALVTLLSSTRVSKLQTFPRDLVLASSRKRWPHFCLVISIAFTT